MSKRNDKERIAYALVRVSTATQKTDSQAVELVEVAKEKGFYIPQEYIFEEQISGYDKFEEDRESIIRLRYAIKEKKPDAIFIWELSRLTRNPEKVSKYINEFSLEPMIPLFIYKFGKEGIWTIENGQINYDNTKLIRACADAVYEELQQIRERTMRGRRDKAKKNLFVGHVADGYYVTKEDTFEIDDDRKKDIIRIFDLYANHNNSTDKVAEILNSEQVKTATHYRATSPKFPNYKSQYIGQKKGVKMPIDRTTSEWTGELVSQTLRNTWYRGERKYKDIPNLTVPKLQEVQDLLEKVDEKLLNKRLIPKSTATKNTYLLSNRIFCGRCGKPMYGHVTGRYNHYYCSSVESGRKCGNRGVNKEITEAIILARIQEIAYNELRKGKDDSFFLKFYKNDVVLKEYKEKLNTAQITKALLEKDLTKTDKAIDQYIEIQGNTPKQDLIQRYSRKIDELYEDKERIKKSIIEKDAIISRTKKLIDATKNIKSLIHEISKAKSVSESVEPIKSIIKRVEVHSPDYYSHVIRIMYVNDYVDDVFYNYRLIKNNYIPLINGYDTKEWEHSKYNETSGYIEFEGDLYWTYGGAKIFDVEHEGEKSLARFQDYCKNNNITDKKEMFRIGEKFDLYLPLTPIYKNKISVRDYIMECKNNAGGLRHITREEPTSARAEKQLQYSREYQKKKNTGLPPSLPRLDKDYDNESIIKECKHIYNRIYKIKHKKRLSPEEKEQQIGELKNRLAVLNATKKYLTREEQLKRRDRP